MSDTRIEIRNGQRCKVTRKRSLITGEEADFVQPLDDDAIENVEVPVLNAPGDKSGQTGQTTQHNNQGIPILNVPTFKDKAVRNDPRLADRVPVLNAPGDIRKTV